MFVKKNMKRTKKNNLNIIELFNKNLEFKLLSE